jgi:DNA modification methylase
VRRWHADGDNTILFYSSLFFLFFVRQNKLNELDSKAWLKFTKTWFVHNPKPRGSKEKLHPAKFPESLIEEFILFFTKKGELVLDPFLGTGSTLVACDTMGRRGVGIELLEKYAAIARGRTSQSVIVGNALDVEKLVSEPVDFVITSPPYGPMLNKKGLAQDKRKAEMLDTKYSDDAADLGNIGGYDEFVLKLAAVFRNVKKVLKQGRYLVIIIQNYRDGPVYRTLAWDIGKALQGDYTLVGERMWCQDNKTLYPYGMGYSFVPNVHHHYCLVLKNAIH